MNAAEFVAKLERAKPTGEGKWMARCPAHDDKTASLAVTQADNGKVLLHCHASCATESILAVLGLGMKDLSTTGTAGPSQREIAAMYDYRDATGKLLYQAIRFFPKDFRQRRPSTVPGEWVWNLEGVTRVLYQLPDIEAADRDVVVWLCEGEKDADNLASLGLCATTNAGGAGKWAREYSEALRGRRVVVLPDNDPAGEKHAKDVAAALDGIAASVAILRLPGLPAKGDVSDWLKAGGTASKLIALIPKEQRFESAGGRLVGERAERIDHGKRALRFGVTFLDQALGGIMPRDVVLLGAKTGVGKTALSAMIALSNCMAGKRVHYFALEAEDREIERRMKFQIIADAYYRSGYHRAPIRFQDWMAGRLEDQLGQFEQTADAKMRHVTKGLHTFYRLDSFTSDDFRAHLERIKDDTDLVILDHLHYVDTDDENENRGYKRVTKQIRDAALSTGKPIVVVAHVRKGDRRFETAIPGIEDFHGSSDIPKIATKAIMIAPVLGKNATAHLWGTYMQIAKCRTDGSVTRHVALMNFNARKNAYEDEYTIGRLIDGGKAFEALTGEEIPAWCGAKAPAVEVAEPEERTTMRRDWDD